MAAFTYRDVVSAIYEKYIRQRLKIEQIQETAKRHHRR